MARPRSDHYRGDQAFSKAVLEKLARNKAEGARLGPRRELSRITGIRPRSSTSCSTSPTVRGDGAPRIETASPSRIGDDGMDVAAWRRAEPALVPALPRGCSHGEPPVRGWSGPDFVGVR